ncbi:hypothetical protein SKAU_G00359220 [Synaphobranchus kaupii]|uniref:DNA helicase n=1 Tax=Synaphobranchus kaupii TaxID=118154 RepID=A0A9Q1IGY0_SYNKA|nr:hypothetical protein SKAU_G00359220 [Synaphobranchus kaupii]
MKEYKGSASTDSEKENNTTPVITVPETTETKLPCDSKFGRDVVVLDSDSDDSVCGGILVTKPQVWRRREVDPDVSEVIVLSDEEEEELPVEKLQTVFPHRTRKLVVENGSTLDGPAESCMIKCGDLEPTLKRKQRRSSCDSQDGSVQAIKKRRDSLTDDSEAEGPEPSWKNQEDMVKKLQRKFPTLEKEELRDVLLEHDWLFEDTLEALSLFSEPVDDSSLPEYSDKEPVSQNDNGQLTASKLTDDTESTAGCRDVSKNRQRSIHDGRTSCKSKGLKAKTSSPSPSCTADKPLNVVSEPTRVSQRKRQPRALVDHYSGSECDSLVSSDPEEHSEYSDSEREDRADYGLNSRILGFFQEALVDELTLIVGCSAKKAQKIVELRPFGTWEDLVEAFQKGNGLSTELLRGCRLVLRERDVVLGLMSRCENISVKMTRAATQGRAGEGSAKQPEILNTKLQLKPYQLVGMNWLVMLYQNNLSGILADEMGLGKTIQAIAFLASLYEDSVCGPHLIVVPASTLDNWVRELNLWCASLKVLIYNGSIEERKSLRYNILNNKVDYNVIMSTYNLAIGTDSDRSLFRKLKLQYAVFDEGHMLKNMNSLRYRHLMAINAEHRLLLTGTPLQNNLLELMSLLNFIMPSMFSSSTSQITKMFSMKSSDEQSCFEKERIAQAKLIMKPFILRRVKSEVLKQLPEKEECVEFCPMSEKQETLYTTLFQKLKGATNGEKRELNNVMMQLRKMANHPLLHRQYYTSERLATMSGLLLKEPSHKDSNPALIQEDMEVMSDFELHRLCLQYPSLQGLQLGHDVLLDSGKFTVLTELLASFKDKGDRVVLFSQFTMMLDIVEVLLKHLGHCYLRLDGSTPIADRIVLIDNFNTDTEIFVFLLSTRAGGLGINLTSANVVILHDIDCNPYNDKQAEDRCHRVGQTRTVKVIRLISKDSIEDGMLRVGQKKLKLEQDMTASAEGEEGSMPEDMATLLRASLGL